MTTDAIVPNTFDAGDDAVIPDTFDWDPGSPSQIFAADAASKLQTRNEKLFDTLTKGVPAAGIGFADTLLQSLSFGAVGDMDVEEFVTNNLPESFARFFSENKAGAQTVGDLVGMFIPLTAGIKLARADSMLARAVQAGIKDERVARAMFSTGRSMDDLAKPALDAAAVVASKRGADYSSDVAFKLAASKANRTTFGDVLKESLFADAAIVATMNQSSTLFPEDVPATSLAGMFLGFDVAAAAVGAAAQKFTLRRQLNALGPLFAELRNPQGLPMKDIIDRVGTRHFGIAVRGFAMKDLDEARRLSQGDSEALTNISSEYNRWNQELFGEGGQVRLLGEDNPLPGMTHKATLSEQELNTLRPLAIDDPSGMVGVISLDRLGENSHTLLPAEKARQLREVDRDLAKTQEELRVQWAAAKAGEQSMEVPAALQEQFEALLKKQQLIKESGQFVIEIDGSMTPIAARKPLAQELGATIRPQKKAGPGEAKLQVVVPHDNKPATTIGLTEEGLLVLPKAEVPQTPAQAEKIKQFTVTKEGVTHEDAEGLSKLLLQDIGEDWHFKDGKRGKAVFGGLPEEIATNVKRWVGDSNSGSLRRWLSEGSPEAESLIRAYQDAGLHRRLEEIADADGTITLFRGETKAETVRPTNDVVSTTSSFGVAKSFGAGGGSHVVAVKVPIDDIVMVVGGAGQEFEFIVKGAATRAKLGSGPKAKPGEIATHANFQALVREDKTAVYMLTSRFVAGWKPGNQPLRVYPGMHHTQLDMAAEMLERHGQSSVQFVGKTPFRNSDDLEWAALQSKFEEFQETYQKQAGSKIVIPDSQRLSIYDLAKIYNLPNHPTGAMHPMLQLFEELAQGGEKLKLGDFYKDLNEFKSAIAKHAGVDEIDSSMPLRGFMARQTDDKAPVVATFGQQPRANATQEAVAQKVQAVKLHQLEMLRDGIEENAPFVNALINNLESRPELVKVARGVEQLFESGQTGRGVFTTQAFQVRGDPVLEAANLMADVYYRESLQLTKQRMQPHEQLWHEIQAKRNEASLNMFMQARNALGRGWDVEAGAIKGEEGLFHFVLKDTANNRSKFAKEFPEQVDEFTEGMFLPSTVHTGPGARAIPIAVDEMSIQALRSFDELFQGTLREINHLRRAQGKPPIPAREWYLPAKNLARAESIFLMNSAGKVDMVVSGANINEATRLARKEIEAAKADNITLYQMSRDDVEKHFDTLDEVFGGMVNFSNSRLQTGGRKGTSFGQVVETGEDVFKDLINSVARQHEHLARETMHMMFESELQYARHMKSISAKDITEGSERVQRQAAQRETKWDLYANALYQKAGLNPNSPVGSLFYGVQSFYDATVSNAVQKLNIAYQNSKGADHVTREHERVFKELESTMGEFNPFQSALDFAQRTESVKVPGNMLTHMSQLNAWTTNLFLRILDGGMMVVNFASLPAIIPAVAKGLHRGPGETAESWRARTGAFATPITDDVALWEPTRAVTSGIHFMFSDEGRQLWREARQRGYLAQEVAERMEIITHPAEGYVQNIITRGVNKLSIPTDWSETTSRGIAFSTFYNMGKKNLLLQHEDALAFAHKQANAVIGDFRPSNKPDIFQGASGMPLGLFTTFIWNFWQRVAMDIEGRRWGAATMQGVLQGSLFGAESLPGFDMFVRTFTETYDGDTNMVDGLRDRFGEDATNFFLSGTVANLPRMLGLSDDGLAIQTRADVDFPLGRVPGMTAPPGFGMIKTAYDGLSEVVRSLSREGGFNSRDLQEIVSNYGLNGFLKGAINVNMGQKVDRRGNLVLSDINSGMEITAQLMSLKTQKEVEKARALGRSQHIMKRRQELLDDTGAMIRSRLRAGKLDAEGMDDIMRQYERAGGDYKMFQNFLVSQAQRGLVERTELKALEAFKRSYLQGEAARYLMLLDDGDHGEFSESLLKGIRPEQ